MKKQLCFVVMGYGKRRNYHLGIEVNLDQVYVGVIKPVLEDCGYVVVRGDEITDCGAIDNSMYALLLKADLVVADMSTLNPNAIYEVGVRHALRPYHTILMIDNRDNFFFDLNHNRIIAYQRDGGNLSEKNVKYLKERLMVVVKSLSSTEHKIDSPVFETINGLERYAYNTTLANPYISNELLVNGAKDSIRELVHQAEGLRKQNNFKEALPLWKKLAQAYPHEVYYVQQYALCTYQSGGSENWSCYMEAMRILDTLPDGNDIETNSLKGAVCKRLYLLSETSKNPAFDLLQRAIDYYGRMYRLTENYYPGENYIYCMELMAKNNPKYSQEEKQDMLDVVLVERKRLYHTLRDLAMGIVHNEVEKPDFWLLSTFCAICKSLEKEEFEVSEKYLFANAEPQVIQSYKNQNKR